MYSVQSKREDGLHLRSLAWKATSASRLLPACHGLSSGRRSKLCSCRSLETQNGRTGDPSRSLNPFGLLSLAFPTSLSLQSQPSASRCLFPLCLFVPLHHQDGTFDLSCPALPDRRSRPLSYARTTRRTCLPSPFELRPEFQISILVSCRCRQPSFRCCAACCNCSLPSTWSPYSHSPATRTSDCGHSQHHHPIATVLRNFHASKCYIFAAVNVSRSIVAAAPCRLPTHPKTLPRAKYLSTQHPQLLRMVNAGRDSLPRPRKQSKLALGHPFVFDLVYLLDDNASVP